MKKYAITINDQNTVEIEKEQEQVKNLDMIQQSDGSYHLLHDHTSYRIEVLDQDSDKKELKLLVNGESYHLKIEDEYDQLVRQLGLGVVATQKINEIKAPMPGLVLELNVETGQTIAKGDPLLILEAMKMENVIKSAGDGVVEEILVEKGAAVEKGALLIKLV
jgi:Acetyl/propionyl-CoA carboxylase, alpha subunit